MKPLDIAKFWMKVVEDKSSKIIRDSQKWYGYCWNWQGHKKKGYGDYSFHQQHFRAHRVAYELCYGKIPSDKFVCHKCDNPSCVNPQHLFLGSPKENTQDMISKNRLNRFRGNDKGISYRKETGKWRVRYMKNYTNILLDEFETYAEALLALKKARETP